MKKILNLKKAELAFSVLKKVLASDIKNIEVFEVWSSNCPGIGRRPIQRTALIGYLITRSDGENQSDLRFAFAQYFCFSVFGNTLIFDGKEGDTLYVNWSVKPLKEKDLASEEILKKIHYYRIIGVLEPTDTETPYFGKLNHLL